MYTWSPSMSTACIFLRSIRPSTRSTTATCPLPLPTAKKVLFPFLHTPKNTLNAKRALLTPFSEGYRHLEILS